MRVWRRRLRHTRLQRRGPQRAAPRYPTASTEGCSHGLSGSAFPVGIGASPDLACMSGTCGGDAHPRHAGFECLSGWQTTQVREMARKPEVTAAAQAAAHQAAPAQGVADGTMSREQGGAAGCPGQVANRRPGRAGIFLIDYQHQAMPHALPATVSQARRACTCKPLHDICIKTHDVCVAAAR